MARGKGKTVKTSYWLILGVLSACGLQAAACSSSFTSCQDTRTCVSTPDGGSAAGEGGSPADGETPGQGGRANEAGGPSEQGGTAGQIDTSDQGGAAGVPEASPTLGDA